jgi:hypothetical protein
VPSEELLAIGHPYHSLLHFWEMSQRPRGALALHALWHCLQRRHRISISSLALRGSLALCVTLALNSLALFSISSLALFSCSSLALFSRSSLARGIGLSISSRSSLALAAFRSNAATRRRQRVLHLLVAAA